MIDILEPESGCGTTGPVQVPEFINNSETSIKLMDRISIFSEVDETFVKRPSRILK
ncbi:MAG: hypothetical protein VYE57_03960 [SAR324 cluster bacterium]|nr:hypothetical protein [SAR324 cluster bacterium]